MVQQLCWLFFVLCMRLYSYPAQKLFVLEQVARLKQFNSALIDPLPAPLETLVGAVKTCTQSGEFKTLGLPCATNQTLRSLRFFLYVFSHRRIVVAFCVSTFFHSTFARTFKHVPNIHRRRERSTNWTAVVKYEKRGGFVRTSSRQACNKCEAIDNDFYPVNSFLL